MTVRWSTPAAKDRAGVRPDIDLHGLRHTMITEMLANTSAATTSAGGLSTTAKNVFRSWATARSVFGRARPATNARYESTSGSPNA
jgi:hypothetical protein